MQVSKNQSVIDAEMLSDICFIFYLYLHSPLILLQRFHFSLSKNKGKGLNALWGGLEKVSSNLKCSLSTLQRPDLIVCPTTSPARLENKFNSPLYYKKFRHSPISFQILKPFLWNVPVILETFRQSTIYK